MNEQQDQTLKAEIRALPELDPPPGVWDRVLATSTARKRWMSRRPFALAACLIAAVALSLLVVEQSERDAGINDDALVMQASVADLIEESQRLEERLRSLPFQGAYGDTGRVLAYRIADVDSTLNELYLQDMGDSAERARLLRQRAVLLQSLVEVEAQDRAVVFRKVAF